MLLLSGCGNFSGPLLEKQAPGLEPGSLRSGDERTNHEAIGPPVNKYFLITYVFGTKSFR